MDIRWWTTSWSFRRFGRTWRRTAPLWLMARQRSCRWSSIACGSSVRSSSTTHIGHLQSAFVGTCPSFTRLYLCISGGWTLTRWLWPVGMFFFFSQVPKFPTGLFDAVWSAHAFLSGQVTNVELVDQLFETIFKSLEAVKKLRSKGRVGFGENTQVL